MRVRVSMRVSVSPIVRGVAAAAIVAAVLPTTAPAAHGDPGPVYGGYTASSWASPVRIEVYDPSIPLPTSPQVEVELGYTNVQADSSSSQGRASYLWPGDSVGEGFAVYAEQLGLPPDAFADGYPVQVNSSYPSDTTSQRDEPFPGMVMRTESGDKTAMAQSGFSPDGEVSDPDSSEDGGAGNGPLPGPLGQPGSAGPLAPAAPSETAADEELPGLPGPLATLVDMEGYVSTSRTTAVDGPVVNTSRTILGDVKLLGGLVTISGIDARARAETSGTKGKSSGRSDWGVLSLAGQEFAIGPDGAIAGGQSVSLPGLPADPATALLQLGISIQVPEPVRTVEGDQATSVSQGLVVVIDTAVLAPVLRALPAAALAQLIPDDAGPLKSLISGLNSLAPRIVLTLGIASSMVDTEPPVDPLPPPGDGEDPPEDTGDNTGDNTAEQPGSNDAPTSPGDTSPPTDDAPASPTDTAPLVNTSAPLVPGLPPLFSIPGMLLICGVALAAFAGGWFRRLGAAALGGGAACQHGLDSGLPDLRKA